MIKISQPKIASLAPRWAPFPGFSLLFDAPSEEYRSEEGIEFLDCDVTHDHAPELYRRAFAGLAALDPEQMLRAYGFCALPTHSYHVTAFDVANVADLERCRPEMREELRVTLDLLPSRNAFTASFLERSRAIELGEPLKFVFKELCHWGSVVAIQLQPANEETFERFVAQRVELSNFYLERFGVGARPSFTPHLSLGYFMNEEGSDLARKQIGRWNETMANSVGEAAVTFSSVSLHGFIDMATFFRVVEGA